MARRHMSVVYVLTAPVALPVAGTVPIPWSGTGKDRFSNGAFR